MANQEVLAGYLMLDLPLSRRFKVTGGARYESTLLDVASHEASLTPGKLDEKDWLPSLNTVYQVVDNMNIRGVLQPDPGTAVLSRTGPVRLFPFRRRLHFRRQQRTETDVDRKLRFSLGVVQPSRRDLRAQLFPQEVRKPDRARDRDDER